MKVLQFTIELEKLIYQFQVFPILFSLDCQWLDELVAFDDTDRIKCAKVIFLTYGEINNYKAK